MGEARPLKLRYTPRAGAELDTVLTQIAQRSPHGARRVQARIQAVIARLAQYPESGQRTSHPRLRRIVVVPFPYLVFYEVTDEEIIIHAVRHGARDPGSMPGRERS